MRLFPSLALFLFCCIATAQTPNYSALLLEEDLTKNANAVTRLNEMTVDIVSIKEMNVRLKRIVTVLNKHGNSHVEAMIGYNNSVKVKKVEARIFDARGELIKKIKEKDFHDVSAVDGGTLYSDSRVKFMGYTPVQYPYTVEFSYEITTENTANIPSWYFLDGFMVSTEKSRYKVSYVSPEFKPVVKEKNLEKLSIQKSETPNSIIYEATQIDALTRESLSPSFRKLAPKLMVRMENFHYEGIDATIRDWKDAGDWIDNHLLNGRAELPPSTKSKALSLVKDITDPLEKAKVIYKYVQENTRYISVQVGIGGIQPISAIEVDKVKYGDCKGLSNYTKALLEVIGVPAYYTHVEAGRDKVDFEEDFADLAQGNHVILAIPYKGQYYWIDCTSQVHPFGFIGDFTDDRKVMIITPEGGEIVSTPSYLNEDNYQKTEATYTLNKEGDISGNIKIITKGIQYDNRFFLESEIPEKVDTHYKNYWGDVNNLKLINFQFKNDNEAISFTEELNVEASKYASINGDRILFAPNAFNKSRFIPNRHRDRKLPFEIQRGFLDEDEYFIEIPEGYTIEALPEGVELNSKFGTYVMLVERIEDMLVFRRKILIKEGMYEKSDYENYRNFMKKISKYDNSKIVIKLDS